MFELFFVYFFICFLFIFSILGEKDLDYIRLKYTGNLVNTINRFSIERI